MKKYNTIFLSCLLLLFVFCLVGCNKIYTVEFVDEDNTLLSSQEVQKNQAAVAPEEPTKEGYLFDKWDQDFSKVTKDLTIKAIYKKAFKVRFKNYENKTISSQTIKEGDAAKAPKDPIRPGYEFTGWDKDFSNVTEDLVIKPLYKEAVIDTRFTDGLRPDFDYQGKNFITDGVGVVKLNRVVDGDTISVYTQGAGQPITIRFLGIDTPESTGTIEPWGKAASKYAKDTLYDAESIMLEAEGERKDSGGKRYLAWVWYIPKGESEYRLFNLEEIELGYTKYSQKVDSKYHEVMKKATDKTKQIGIKVWGEVDPNFNYSKETIETNLLNLWYNHDKYTSGTYFYVTVRLVRTVGNNMYLEDAEEQSLELEDGGKIITGKGAFYAFYGYVAPFYRYYKIGDVFKMRCQLEWGSDYGSQLTGLSKYSSPQEDKFALPDIPRIDANDLSYTKKEVKNDKGEMITDRVSDLSNYFCKVITVDNLICESVRLKGQGDDKYYSAIMKNNNGDKFDVHFSNHLISKWKADEILIPGHTYSITGGVAYYAYANGYYQLSVGDAPRYSNGEIYQEDLVRVDDIKEIIK